MRYLYISLGINFFIIISVILLRPFLPPVVPLFYGRAIGEDQLVKSIWLIIPSLVSISITLINFFLNKYAIKDSFLKKVLTNTSLFINLLVLITVVKIILLVGLFK